MSEANQIGIVFMIHIPNNLMKYDLNKRQTIVSIVKKEINCRLTDHEIFSIFSIDHDIRI